MKNLFDYATKELEQDAFLLWLFESWEDDQVKPLVHNLLERFCGIDKNEEIIKINSIAQWKNIDVLITITTKSNRTINLIIEDKTFSQEHSNQLKRYNEDIKSLSGEPKKVFYKTDDIDDEERKRVTDAGWTVFDLNAIGDLFKEQTHSPVFLVSQYAEHIKELIDIRANKEKPDSSWTRNDLAKWVAYFKNTIIPSIPYETNDCWAGAWGTRYRYACMCFAPNREKTNSIPYLEIRSRDCLQDKENHKVYYTARVLCYGIDEKVLDEKQPKLIAKAKESKFWETKHIHGKKGKNPKQACYYETELENNSDEAFISITNECFSNYLDLIDEWDNTIKVPANSAIHKTDLIIGEEKNEILEQKPIVLYEEPTDFRYIIIKVQPWRLNGMKEQYPKTYRYEATRYCWDINPRDIKEYPYVFSVTHGMVEEVFKINDWYFVDDRDRYAFHGEIAPEEIRSRFVGKRIPETYRKKGMAYPVLYSKNY